MRKMTSSPRGLIRNRSLISRTLTICASASVASRMHSPSVRAFREPSPMSASTAPRVPARAIMDRLSLFMDSAASAAAVSRRTSTKLDQ